MNPQFQNAVGTLEEGIPFQSEYTKRHVDMQLFKQVRAGGLEIFKIFLPKWGLLWSLWTLKNKQTNNSIIIIDLAGKKSNKKYEHLANFFTKTQEI